MAGVSKADVRRNSDQRIQIARTIRMARAAMSVDQAELAEMLGVTRTTVWRWEKGDQEPMVSQYADIMRLAGLPTPYFTEARPVVSIGDRCARRDSNPQPSVLEQYLAIMSLLSVHLFRSIRRA